MHAKLTQIQHLYHTQSSTLIYIFPPTTYPSVKPFCHALFFPPLLSLDPSPSFIRKYAFLSPRGEGQAVEVRRRRLYQRPRGAPDEGGCFGSVDDGLGEGPRQAQVSSRLVKTVVVILQSATPGVTAFSMLDFLSRSRRPSCTVGRACLI